MHGSVAPIAVIQGAAGEAIQALLARFATRWSGTARIAGLIEEPDGNAVRSIVDGSRYGLFQDLGTQSAACGLDTDALVRAGEAVRRDIAAGCDLVILSKFGKLEAENRSGLLAAFSAAAERHIPILTSVAPRHAAAWNQFADPLSVLLPPDLATIERWWWEAGGRRSS
ncbi:MAG: DUF2478 domain-containing protein [Sphingobium sp.]